VDLVQNTALAEPLAKGLSIWGGYSVQSNQLLHIYFVSVLLVYIEVL